VGAAGRLYRSNDQAIALIRESAQWTPERWAATRLAAVEHAYQWFADIRVLAPLFAEWQRLAEEGRRDDATAPDAARRRDESGVRFRPWHP
jgi:hypothetical protein